GSRGRALPVGAIGGGPGGMARAMPVAADSRRNRAPSPRGRATRSTNRASSAAPPASIRAWPRTRKPTSLDTARVPGGASSGVEGGGWARGGRVGWGGGGGQAGDRRADDSRIGPAKNGSKAGSPAR